MSIHEEDKEIEWYKKHTNQINQTVASKIIDALGLDNVLYSLIHKLICVCIDTKIPREIRREWILEKINKEIDRWQ